MHILLANDDGIYAPGLAALERELQSLGEVTVVAPLTEQSGVGHSITYLHPLVTTEAFDGDRQRGWIVEGSPADCVKLGVTQFCKKRPDLIVSGINNGLNAGINVLYSGTVAAAIEGAFFGITSVAVSLEFAAHADWPAAAKIARQAIAQLVAQPQRGATLYNLNIPQQALHQQPELRVAPMGVARYGDEFEKRKDPRGRWYYWSTNEPPAPQDGPESDLTLLAQGYVTLTPLDFDLTRHDQLAPMRGWKFAFES